MEIRIEPTAVRGAPSSGEPEGAEWQDTAGVVADEYSEEEDIEHINSEPVEETGLEKAPPSSEANGSVLVAGVSYPFVVHIGTFASAEDAEEAVGKWRTDGHLTYPVLFRTSD
jgi:cell division septation protein DedD